MPCMKKLIFYIGKIGSGKSHTALRREADVSAKKKIPCEYIEVSELVLEQAAKLAKSEVGLRPSRKECQEVKQKMMKENPRWLLDLLLQGITNSLSDTIFVSGLREKWIFDELEARYPNVEIYIVEADEEVRAKRRSITLEELRRQEERDNEIGLGAFLEAVRNRAKIIENNY